MEMIAMLDGLGMNTDGTYPIGDVNPATSPRYYKGSRPAALPPASPSGVPVPVPMTSYPLAGGLGNTPEPPADDTEREPSQSGGFLGITLPGWLGILGIIAISIPLAQKFFGRRVPVEAPQPVNGFGYAEPEMIEFPKKKRRRRRRK